ncbi:aminotransferase class V-fold PLP-dependent enzyme, partial [Streptomyces sp. CC77]|uniref:aminotransferase class V-fold PLP-dependent enzyme n=1 Tax=Streptomyces sp. CC77 TaxID=1906739 RepID=UPI0034A36C4A
MPSPPPAAPSTRHPAGHRAPRRALERRVRFLLAGRGADRPGRRVHRGHRAGVGDGCEQRGRGQLQPVAEFAAPAHECGALFLCDAAQTAGKIPLRCLRSAALVDRRAAPRPDPCANAY